MRKAPKVHTPSQYDKKLALLRNREYVRAKLDAIKEAAGGCKCCNRPEPPCVLQFDHLPGTKKRFNISQARTGRIPWSVVEKELKKCQLICANCHIKAEVARALTALPVQRRQAA